MRSRIRTPFFFIPWGEDSTPSGDESPSGPVAGRALVERQAHLPVLGADTAVVAGRRVLGKPADAEEAAAMQIGSPFDYTRQVRLVVRRDLPDPAREPTPAPEKPLPTMAWARRPLSWPERGTWPPAMVPWPPALPSG